ncbi:hypothetical protein HMPREF1548_05434 [Clostridium sp. KLE 1755]|nr:hypothetical protein HMPREF1548_05434 [Clostridium sp. KLE 1755]
MIYDSIAKTIKVSRTAEGQQFDQDWTVSAEGHKPVPPALLQQKESGIWFP